MQKYVTISQYKNPSPPQQTGHRSLSLYPIHQFTSSSLSPPRHHYLILSTRYLLHHLNHLLKVSSPIKLSEHRLSPSITMTSISSHPSTRSHRSNLSGTTLRSNNPYASHLSPPLPPRPPHGRSRSHDSSSTFPIRDRERSSRSSRTDRTSPADPSVPRTHRRKISRIPAPDPIDVLGSVLDTPYHHDGPFEATLLARQVPGRAPVDALKWSNAQTIIATPAASWRDCFDSHYPLSGVAAYPPGKGGLGEYEEYDIQQRDGDLGRYKHMVSRFFGILGR